MHSSVLVSLLLIFSAQAEISYDRYGYVLYCPCMGRFGNQADHFLGALSFAKKLNRTLVIPPWITYDFKASPNNGFVPYGHWFKTDSIKKYHKAIEMQDFMTDLAPSLWPPENRVVYCHKLAMDRSDDKNSCPAKSGNPFGPFWDEHQIDFIRSEAFPSYLSYHSDKGRWDKAFPIEEHLIIAFMGAPASYPVLEKDRQLQRYVDFNDKIIDYTRKFTALNLQRPYLALHLRNGMDWKRACEHIGEKTEHPFMSSPQCTGYGRPSPAPFTKAMCFPSDDIVKSQVLETVIKDKIRSVFVATDARTMESDFLGMFRKHNLSVSVVKLDYNSLIDDLAVLIEADQFIGNCGSSVTAFAVRKREILGKPNNFFGKFDPKSKLSHTDL